MKKDIKKQLPTLKQEELLGIKGGKQYIPADFYVPAAPSFGIWEEFEIRFDDDTGGTKKLPGSNKDFASLLAK